MDFSLQEEHQLLKNSARDFMRKECTREFLNELEEKEEFPFELCHKMAKLGWFKLIIPEKYGGVGGNILDMVMLEEELSRGGAGITQPFAFSTYMGSNSLINYGNERQKEYYLPKIANGEIRFAGAFTEPGGGTDLLATKTSAVLDGDDFVINGQKSFISGAQWVDYMILFVETNKNAIKRTKSFSQLIVTPKAPGVELKRINTLGFKVSGIYEVFFDDVRVPRENLIGDLDNGFKQLLGTLNTHRISCASQCLGIGQAALDFAVEYAKQRFAFGKPIGQFQAIQHYLARSTLSIQQARLLTYKAAWLMTQGKPCGLEAGMAKVAASEAAEYITRVGMSIMGGHGYVMEHEMQRHFREARVLMFAPVANEMALNEIGESLGLPRSY